MEAQELLRIVALRNGKLKATEFKLREGETGLSLFARTTNPRPYEVLEAVRAAGKQGQLAVALLPADGLKKLGLRLVQTPGGTPLREVNAIYYEARLPPLRRLLLILRGIPLHQDFNERISGKLCALAQILEGDNLT